MIQVILYPCLSRSQPWQPIIMMASKSKAQTLHRQVTSLKERRSWLGWRRNQWCQEESLSLRLEEGLCQTPPIVSTCRCRHQAKWVIKWVIWCHTKRHLYHPRCSLKWCSHRWWILKWWTLRCYNLNKCWCSSKWWGSSSLKCFRATLPEATGTPTNSIVGCSTNSSLPWQQTWTAAWTTCTTAGTTTTWAALTWCRPAKWAAIWTMRHMLR